MRAAYLYTFLTNKLVKLGFKVNSDEPEVSYFIEQDHQLQMSAQLCLVLKMV